MSERSVYEFTNERLVMAVYYDSERVIPSISPYRFRVVEVNAIVDSYISVQELVDGIWMAHTVTSSLRFQMQAMETALRACGNE